VGKKGFTLTELIIVLTIISILAAIAIPAYVGQQKRAARTEAFTNLEALRLLEEQSYSENAVYEPTGGGAINYNATIGVADNGIEDVLTGFRPGGQATLPGLGLNFSYQIVQNRQIDTPIANPPTWNTVQTPCFTAIATGIAGSRVTGDVFAIDCNNNKNF